MNPLIFTCSKALEYPQEFLDEVHKILVVVGATNIVKVELSSYQLKAVAQTRCKMWQDSQVLGGVLVLVKEATETILASMSIPNSKRGSRVHGTLTLRGVQNLEEGRREPKKGNEGDMQRPRKKCAKCGCADSGECRQGTNACSSCGKRVHMVKDCPLNRGQAGGYTLSFVTPLLALTFEMLP
ncbi:uncharacterized protein [Solanum lycopersicum]|uniref:uncharacterized protein n=1 Tax=Solanum lycopersicum TaxID=4081 RepID=UPI000532E7F3|nr:uncharacterized protein LOC104644965 [Solanum lycopersicum]